MTNVAKPRGPGRSAHEGSGRAQALVGYAVAAACLTWVFHDVDLSEVVRSAAHVRWGWMLPAIGLDVGSYLCQGWRWRLLLPQPAALGVIRVTQAIYAGLFVSEILPARLGELVRGYLVQRWSGVAPARVVGSILVERLFDGAWLALGMVAVALAVPLPRRLAEAEDILGGSVLVAGVLLLVVILRVRRAAGRRRAAGAEASAEASAPGLVSRLAQALAATGSSRRSAGAFAVSALVPLLEGLGLWLVMVGYGLPMGAAQGIAVLLIVRLGTAIPNAPGNVGTYQAVCVLALRLFGVAKAPAAGFSIVAFVVLTVPLWGLGLLALARSGTTLGTLRRELQGVAAASR